ncbi:eae-like domain protein [Escherichia coli]|uniref:eae-like domain protein n=1 Tax=Escherichia coli TaxID=562 RepID=UPI001D0B50ED|nr:eae-like domain protein [Escherichia coli]MCB8583296.1 eae-like domain protein [Escherichia coli]MCB8685145.1 eae-like domain protein [Escherichia coli]MCB8689861.1 eae-like domain protein [Escherichia coli]MCB8701229.1 eae-like domain protein [Escherichia coli]MCB8710715.1 eae-like domain protein [Escherichia coli]
MDGNIKGLVSAGHEMASELKAECGAVDMRSVARLISDLATQLEVQLVRANALAAENAGIKAICDDRRRFIMNGVQMGYIKVPAAETDPDLETIRIAISPQKPIPATDAFLAEVRAQGLDAAIEAAKNLVAQEYEYKDFKAAQSDCCMHPGSDLVGKVEMTEWLVDFAAQLRKGGNQ